MNSHRTVIPRATALKRNLQDGDVIRENVKMEIELMFCEETILQEIADKNFTRDSIAITYVFCMDSSEKVDFAKINKAIITQRSRNALKYIKKGSEEDNRGKKMNEEIKDGMIEPDTGFAKEIGFISDKFEGIYGR